MVKEAAGDTEMIKMLEDDLVRLLGNAEEYGEIEELQEEIVEVLLPKTKAD